jgi:hypothetical protein
MREFQLMVPTYNADYFPAEVKAGLRPEIGPPELPVVVREAAGVRIVLGSHDHEDCTKSDVQIERHPNGWMIFLHPLGGSDACAYVFFTDDGRSYLMKELPYGPTPPLVEIEGEKNAPEIYGSFNEIASPDLPATLVLQRCALCSQLLEPTGDWYLDLCPACADSTDGT